MGNCDFKSEEDSSKSAGISKSNFQKQYPIGRGGYGKVWKVKLKNEEKHYAMKEMFKSLVIAKKSVTSVMFERELLSRLKNEFVVNMCYAFQDNEKLYMVMELSCGGDLRYHLYKNKKFDERETKFIVCCLIIALEYIHNNAIIHRDIKPENILFDTNGYLKITDFGIARTFSPNNQQDTSGTPGYMAPEVIKGQQHGFTADYFALGVIIHELMLGRRPFPGIVRKEYKENILHMNPQVRTSEVPQNWNQDVADLINKLITRKEESRLGKLGAKSVKSHPWFNDVNWDEIENHRVSAPFVPRNIEDYFDETYLESFEKNEKLLQDIENAKKTLRNPNTHKQFKEYYFDKDKQVKTQLKSTNPTTINSIKTVKTGG